MGWAREREELAKRDVHGRREEGGDDANGDAAGDAKESPTIGGGKPTNTSGTALAR
jgi:hypothetical protein